MDAETKVARHRLSVLELAQTLGNVSEACRRRGLDRSMFYEWKKRFETQGLEGLKDLPPIHKTHPQTTPPEIIEKVKALALQHPARGCAYLSNLLALDGIKLSSVTVQEILNRHDLGTKFDRWLALEKTHQAHGLELSPEQVAMIEKMNPVFRERHVESSAPGELLCADTFTVGSIKGIGRIIMHTVVDTYGSMAFGVLHTSKQPEAAVAVLHNDALPFYKEHGLKVGAVLTDNGREFCGTDAHPYEMYLILADVDHRRTRIRTPRTNGFVERFNRTVKDEFFATAFRQKLYTSVDELQVDLDEWLLHYNYARPHLGYRNHGRRPFDTVEVYLAKKHEDEAALARVPVTVTAETAQTEQNGRAQRTKSSTLTAVQEG
jgi:transposase InsO family protein